MKPTRSSFSFGEVMKMWVWLTFQKVVQLGVARSNCRPDPARDGVRLRPVEVRTGGPCRAAPRIHPEAELVAVTPGPGDEVQQFPRSIMPSAGPMVFQPDTRLPRSRSRRVDRPAGLGQQLGRDGVRPRGRAATNRGRPQFHRVVRAARLPAGGPRTRRRRTGVLKTGPPEKLPPNWCFVNLGTAVSNRYLASKLSSWK